MLFAHHPNTPDYDSEESHVFYKDVLHHFLQRPYVFLNILPSLQRILVIVQFYGCNVFIIAPERYGSFSN
jgi:hypothetical protein